MKDVRPRMASGAARLLGRKTRAQRSRELFGPVARLLTVEAERVAPTPQPGA